MISTDYSLEIASARMIIAQNEMTFALSFTSKIEGLSLIMPSECHFSGKRKAWPKRFIHCRKRGIFYETVSWDSYQSTHFIRLDFSTAFWQGWGTWTRYNSQLISWHRKDCRDGGGLHTTRPQDYLKISGSVAPPYPESWSGRERRPSWAEAATIQFHTAIIGFIPTTFLTIRFGSSTSPGQWRRML